MALWAVTGHSTRHTYNASLRILGVSAASAAGQRYAMRLGQRTLSSIVYADRGIVVANKPSGLVCQLNHQGGDGNDGTQDALEDFLSDIKDELRLKSTPIPVHRLDKTTTGALLLALNPQLAKDLSQQLQSRTIEKTYLAIVRAGSKTFPAQKGSITNTIAIDSEGRVNLASPSRSAEQKDGSKPEKMRAAETGWEVLATSNTVPLTLIQLTLHTGIKHQLRLHMARCLGAPILGDTLFSTSSVSPAISQVVAVPAGHMYLHASQVSLFRYAPSGKRQRVSVVAPLPGYFTRLCAKVSIPLSRDVIKGGVWIDGERVGNAGYISGTSKKVDFEES